MQSKKLKTTKSKGCRGRHWFTEYGLPGARAPVCVRYGCDAKNPYWNKRYYR